MTFTYFQKPNKTWIWWLVTDKQACVKAHCAVEFASRKLCRNDIRRVSEAMATADMQEGAYRA